jgi:hypothetical protein
MFLLCAPLATVRLDIAQIHRRALAFAIGRVYDSDKSACIDMDCRQSHFSNEMAGERPLNMDTKTNLDVRVWSWYAVYLAREFGTPEELEPARRLDVAKKRMARAELKDAPTVAHERTA